MTSYSFLQIKNKTFNDFYMLFCGIQDCKPLHSFGPAIKTNYLIHYVLDGKGYYYVGNKKYTVKKGQCFLIYPNTVVFYQADKYEPWNYMWLGFDGIKAEEYLSYCGLNKNNLIIECQKGNTLKEYILEMINHNSLSYENELHIEGLTFLFFSVLAESSNMPYKKSENNYNIYVNKTIEYIQNNYQNKITVKDLAKYLSLNRSYLTSVFKKFLNMSPQQFLLKFRITKASEMLTKTDMSIGNISRSCGYEDPLSFSKAFKKVKGISPSNFRKNKREPYKVSKDDPHLNDKI